MKRLHIWIVLLSLFSIRLTAHACSCHTGDPPYEFNRAKAVFIGQMLGGTETHSAEDQDGKEYSIESGAVRFDVEEIFKGSVAGQIVISIDSMKGTSCGTYGLKRGEQYLVYAYGSEKSAGALYTGVCTRTTPTNSPQAKEDLDFLRSLPPAGTGGSIRGRIGVNLRNLDPFTTPLPKVRVNIRGADNQVITVSTDEKGEFEVRKLRPGKYTVEPEFPPNYATDYPSQEVVIDDLGTGDVGFQAYIDGKVQGHIFDKDGHGYNSAFLHLESGNKSVYGHSTGEGGGFETRGVPPAEYILYLEMHGSSTDKTRKYYYPGTFDRKRALKIKVGLGKTVESLRFPLPDEFRVRVLEGKVVWEDGKTAEGIEVGLYCPASTRPDGFTLGFGPNTVVTDEQGLFQLECLTTESYWIEARSMNKDGNNAMNPLHSPPMKITPTEDVRNMKLVLSQKGRSGNCGDKP